MLWQTTCDACRLFDDDGKGRPVNGEGHVTGLCKLTRPEVKELIQEDNLADKRTCPDCHHLVSVHVAKDDDAMIWPPQPVGAQSRAQDTWWKVGCEFDVRRYSSFRHNLSHRLKDLVPPGQCTRSPIGDGDEYHVIVELYAQSHQDSITIANKVIQTIQETDVIGDKARLFDQIELVPCQRPSSRSPWIYVPGDDSPRGKKRSLTDYGPTTPLDLPSSWVQRPTKKSRSSDSSRANQEAHVLFRPRGNYASEMKFLLHLVGARDGDLESMQALTLPVREWPHRLYDDFHFYLSWRFEGDTVLLTPTTITEREQTDPVELDIPPVLHVSVAPGHRDIWRRALVLRKYLTLFDLARDSGQYPEEAFKREWKASEATQSECWGG